MKTSVGTSDERIVGESVTQGSIEAGILSSSNLSSGVVDFFSSSEEEISYGPFPLLPQSFQDDLCRLCQDPLSSQNGLDRFENLAESKLLSYNLSKSKIVIMGEKHARKRLMKEFEDSPSTLYGKPLEVVDKESYLGDVIGINTSESITLTINKRIGIAKKAVYEIRSIVEDSRSQVVGGIKTGLLLWNSCVLPFLLNNSGTWINMKKSDIERLSRLQNLFLNNLLNTFHCPIPLMYFDLAVMQIHLQILKEKLLLFHHISCLPEKAVARNILHIGQQRSINNNVLVRPKVWDTCPTNSLGLQPPFLQTCRRRL